jgi:hypothetical protein
MSIQMMTKRPAIGGNVLVHAQVKVEATIGTFNASDDDDDGTEEPTSDEDEYTVTHNTPSSSSFPQKKTAPQTTTHT